MGFLEAPPGGPAPLLFGLAYLFGVCLLGFDLTTNRLAYLVGFDLFAFDLSGCGVGIRGLGLLEISPGGPAWEAPCCSC